MTQLSGDVRYMWIFAGFPGEGASNGSGVVDNVNFQRFRQLFLRQIRPELFYTDTLSVVGFSVIPKCTTSSDLEWLFRVTLCFRAGLAGSDRATFENNCVKTNKDTHILSAAQIFGEDSIFRQYVIMRIFARVL